MAATATPVEKTGPTARLGQENPPAIVPAAADPIYPAEFFAPFQPKTARATRLGRLSRRYIFRVDAVQHPT